MTIRADVNMSFYMRFLLIGVVVFGFGLWSLYDGLVKFPNQIVRANEWKRLENEAEEAKQAGIEYNIADKWVALCESRGWPIENPGEPKTTVDLWFNYAMATICTPLGLWLLGGVYAARGRWIEADDNQLRSSWGQQLRYSEITRLEKRQWRNKGIAKVFYEQDGRRCRFVVDDFKFRRKETDAILCEIESRIDPALITGGPPETPQASADRPEVESDAAAET